MKKIVIFGYLGHGNLGDETNLRQLIEVLRDWDREAKITVISAEPERTSQEYRVVGVGKFNLLGIIRALFEADLLIGNGGGHFQDITSKRSLFYYSALVIIAKLLKVKIFLYGQGIGPIKTRTGKFLAGRVLSMADLITVRDRLSIVAMAELNIRKPEIHFTAEPLLASKGLGEQPVKDFWANRGNGEQRKLGLVIRDLPFIKKGFWDQLLDCLGWESNIGIYLVPVQPRDRDYLQELSANYGLTILPSDSGWEQLQQAVGGLDLLVSVRLHGLVAGVLQGTPCYGLATDPKVEGFCLQLGIPFSSLSSETEWMAICNKISNYLTDSSEETLAYRVKLPFWKARALENQIILKQFLKKI
jgi:polysaccharide pyruvyl transferase CsaB